MRHLTRREQLTYGLAALVLLLAQVALTGCGSPVQKVVAAEQAYTHAANGLAAAVESKRITDPATLLAIKAGALEVDAALDDAKVRAARGESFGDVWPRVNAALDRFLLLYIQHQAEADHAAEPR
jgi:hypothetical protein